jgi:hypothetical protein
MTTIDLGNGQTVQRHHLPKGLLSQLDEATATFSNMQASVRAWVKPMVPMQAAADFSGSVTCNTPGLSGLAYSLGEVGGAILVDQRDVKTFTALGFANVASQQPSQPRVGLVFLDAATGEYLRWNGSAWAPVTLE